MPRTTTSRKRIRKTPPDPAPETPAQLSVDEMRILLSRELHDGVAQTLSSMLLDLDMFRAEQHGRAGVLMQFDQLEQSTRQALSDLREMLVELRARPLGNEDLVKLVKHGILERHENRRHIDYELTVATDWPERIRLHTATELNRIVQQAIENGVQHSGANKIVVALALSGGDHSAVVTITDNGRGLPNQDIFSPRPGLGILGMRERAALLGGEIGLDAGPGGRGTTVRVTVPLSTLTEPRANP